MWRTLPAILYATCILTLTEIRHPDVALGAQASSCADVVFIGSIRMSASQAAELKQLMASKGPEQEAKFAALADLLPAVSLNSLSLTRNPLVRWILGKKSVPEIRKVIETLATTDLDSFAVRLARAETLTPADKEVLQLILESSWEANRQWSMLKVLKKLTISNYLSTAYEIRAKQLGEHTNVEDFFGEFSVDGYTSIAEFVKTTNGISQFRTALQERSKYLTEAALKAGGIKRRWLQMQAKRTAYLDLMLQENSPRWIEEVEQLKLSLKPSVMNWVTMKLAPGFVNRSWRHTEGIIIAVLIGIVSFPIQAHLADKMIEFTKPPFVVERDNKPMINPPVESLGPTQEQINQQKELIKSGRDPFELNLPEN